jgi:molecular chaperone GrpE
MEGKEAIASDAEPREELDAARRDVEALTMRLKYLQADFDNFRKRAAKEAETVVRYAHEGLLARLVPVLDELDAAVQAASGAAGRGLELVRENLLKPLRDAGLQEIPAAGTPFDPYVHECVEKAPDPSVPEGTITAVVRKGYRLQDRILRPAQVIVATGRGETNGEDHRN